MEEELPYEGEGIDVGESAPQTERDDHADNREEDNAGEEADEEQGNEQSQSKYTVDRLLQEINQDYSLEETKPSKIEDHWLLIPKVEETSESKKVPVYEKAITVSSESLNPHPFARMQKIDKLAATSSASVTIVVPSQELLVKVAEQKKSRLQYQANYPPPKYEENRIRVLSPNLRSPFEPGTQVKGALNRCAKLYTVTELEEVVYGKVAESKVAELNTFMSRKDSVYPIGSPTRASEFFNVFLTRRKWLQDEVGDLTFDTYLAFQMLWSHQYENWKANEALPGGTFFYYYGLTPRYAEIKRWWGENVDTIFSCLNVHENSHWVAMVISIPERTVKIYDSGSPVRGTVLLKKAAEPFARMVPYALWLFAEEEHKPSVDRTAFKIDCISKGVPRAKNPYGDCGVYTLKFLECLMMGVQFKPQFLKDINMGKVRETSQRR
ncbi:hypothetical protein F2Q69_00021816 [Brassica cretica]|uniref:Ubiquitin-like protease family profile domain-containing protein n=1 Tax=Brassica cretica TaxID=69181 RepID=A0A8S9QIB1_BRACR|nr:hypothetical protein F2Q69_00021816 [Brassica cretica]